MGQKFASNHLEASTFKVLKKQRQGGRNTLRVTWTIEMKVTDCQQYCLGKGNHDFPTTYYMVLFVEQPVMSPYDFCRWMLLRPTG